MRFSSLLTLMEKLPNLSAMADLYPSMVFDCNFLEKVQEKVSYGFQRWCPEVHLTTEAPLCLKDGSG